MGVEKLEQRLQHLLRVMRFDSCYTLSQSVFYMLFDTCQRLHDHPWCVVFMKYRRFKSVVTQLNFLHARSHDHPQCVVVNPNSHVFRIVHDAYQNVRHGTSTTVCGMIGRGESRSSY